ncbi:hypothetical protein GGX14DRAFT_573950 [Mycena pura]|uniref:F-box domain-containing protein n=1 Tax=Mycena pura TaxID=153505 RepID=A0AAD6UZ19_9AGAR|nr:hypothetical protein GGX14DRAFT_573950 [Mycena pura]
MPARRSQPDTSETLYTEYLYTNFIPSDDECRRIRDLVGLKAQEFEKATDELERLQASVDRVTRKREQLQQFIDSHLALVSPARRLPQDILGEIFMACLSENGYASMKPSEAPLLLCRLCRDWRNLALSMPRLWASLHFPEFLYLRPSHDSAQLELWLNRSGGLPLSIFLAIDTKLVLQSLVDQAHRWENIRLKDLMHSTLKILAQLSPEDVPLLKTVVIENRYYEETILSFLRAAHIRRLSLRSGSFGVQNLTSPLGVSHLCLHELPSVHTLHLLRHCPLLETCTLTDSYSYSLALDVGPRIHLERMRYLCIIERSDSRDVLEHIFLPNLRSLEYSNDGRGRRDFPLDILASLCAPEMVTDLNLSIEISTELLANVLRPFSMLQKLILHVRRVFLRGGVPKCSLFTLLTPSSLSPAEVLCPHLQSICSLGFDAGSDEELLTMIDTRRTGIQPLANVHVAFTRKLQVDILPRLPRDLAIDLCYPTEDDAKLIRPGPDERQVARKSLRFRAPVPPDTLQLQLWRNDLDADWDPISREWLAEYDEWGLEEEELEEDAKDKLFDENSDEDS